VKTHSIGPHWAWAEWRESGWATLFSLFAYRVWVAIRKRRPYIPFSERHGYRVPLRVGPLDIHFLGRYE
jgi:hypothetical protein